MKRGRILVAVDDDAAFDSVVQVAAALADAMRATVSVVHSHDPGSRVAGQERPDRRAVRLLAERGISARIEFRSGEPAAEVLAVVREVRPDLLVMGSRGRSSLVGMLFGSVSQDIAARATCPVLLVRAGASLDAPFTIALAVEGLDGLKPLVRVTRKLAAALQARVYAVHISYPGGEDAERAAFHAAHSHGEQAAGAAAAWLSRAGITVEAKSVIARNGVARALTEFVDSVGADLIVMGSHSPDHPFDAARVGQAISVGHLAGQPVLVTPEKDEASSSAPPRRWRRG